jgi:PAS domain-containing protein
VAETLLHDALRQANEAWRTPRVTLDAMDDAVVLLEVPDATRLGVAERAGRVRFAYANATAAAALGLTSEQLTGMRLDQATGTAWAQELGSLIVQARIEDRACARRVGVPPGGEEVQDARELRSVGVARRGFSGVRGRSGRGRGRR